MCEFFCFHAFKSSQTRNRESDSAHEQKKKAHLGDICKEDDVSNGNDSLLVEHVELLRYSCRKEAASEDRRAGLGDQARV